MKPEFRRADRGHIGAPCNVASAPCVPSFKRRKQIEGQGNSQEANDQRTSTGPKDPNKDQTTQLALTVRYIYSEL